MCAWFVWEKCNGQQHCWWKQAPLVGAAAAAVAIAAGAFFSGRKRLEGRWRQQLDETQRSMVLTTRFCLRQFLQSLLFMSFVCLCFMSCLCFLFFHGAFPCVFFPCLFFLVCILHLLGLLCFLLVFLIPSLLSVLLLCYLSIAIRRLIPFSILSYKRI